MPLGGGGVGERLDRRIGVAQRRSEAERQLAGREQPRGKVLGRLGASLGRHAGALNRYQTASRLTLIPGPAGFPEHVATLLRGDKARGDEQMVRKPVEVSKQLWIERFDPVQCDRRALRSANDRAGEVQR